MRPDGYPIPVRYPMGTDIGTGTNIIFYLRVRTIVGSRDIMATILGRVRQVRFVLCRLDSQLIEAQVYFKIVAAVPPGAEQGKCVVRALSDDKWDELMKDLQIFVWKAEIERDRLLGRMGDIHGGEQMEDATNSFVATDKKKGLSEDIFGLRIVSED
uniref:Uncharacterized protein n=1 Tax=Oryza brachyantha TaxID=4533 RepID=J3N6U7_ORYBR